MTQNDPLLGHLLDGRYQILSRIARGGMATVYQARDERLNRLVAVKVMHTHLADQEAFVRRFKIEAQSAAQMSNGTVVAVFDEGVSPEGYAYLVMELMAGPDLRTELSRHGSLPLGVALTITSDVLTALATAHSRHIVHRDVKPENVMLTEALPASFGIDAVRVHAKVADFGLARALSDASKTSTGALLGTVAYMAPELITTGQGDEAADLYAVGIMLYEMLTGTVPFTGDTAMSVAYQHINEAMPRVSAVAPWLPPEVDSFISLLTAKDPARRPTSANYALDALASIREDISPELLLRRVPVFRPSSSPAPTLALDTNGADTAALVRTEGDDGETALTAVIPGQKDALAKGSERTGELEFLPVGAAGGVTIPPAGSPASAQRGLAAAGTGAAAASSTLTRKERKEARKAEKRAQKAAAKNGRKRGHKKLIAFVFMLVVLLSIGGTLAWWFLFGPGQRVDLPNVTQQAQEQAVQILSKDGFATEIREEFSDTVPQGHVISMTPGPGRVHPDTKIVLVVSKGIEQVEVPSVEGMPRAQAEQTLNQGRLGYDVTEEFHDSVPAGSVISQDPKPGVQVNHDSVVKLLISKGREPLSLPQGLEGQTSVAATKALQSTGFKVTTSQEFSDTVPEGSVISVKTPDGVTQLHRGDTIELVISKGPELIPVPNVFGMQQKKAIKILEDAGFRVEVEKVLGGIFGTVRSQTPTSPQPRGATITITVV